MNINDIFRKISKGAKFSKEFVPKQVKEDKHVEHKVEIKEETEDAVENDVKNTIETATGNNSITLLKGLNINGEKRGKKRKHSNDVDDERKRKLLETERVNHYRNVNKINVVGRHVPEPAQTFDDFGVDVDIIENLKKCGYEVPTAIQKQAIPIMLQDRQVLACAPTGSGKTAAFLVPIIQSLGGPQRQGFRALILCPTRELAKQTQNECIRFSEGRGFKIHIISKINRTLTQYGPKSSKKFDILITTPKRLCFLLKQDPPALSLANVEWLVIDEADKLFETGNQGFREQISEILTACNGTNRKIAMFSATYTPIVAKWCVHNMKRLIRVTIGHRNAATDSVDQELLFVGNEQGKLLAIREVIRKSLNPPVLVFVQSKERAQQLYNELLYDGVNIDAIHADRTQLQRDNAVKSFREGRTWVLVCTELMSRGVDFKGVNLVINYDFPPSAISYVHRIGRTGRAGCTGKAITFFTIEDSVNLRSIAHVIKESGCEVPAYMLTMKKRSKKERKQLEISAPKRDDIFWNGTRKRFTKLGHKDNLNGKKHPVKSNKKENDVVHKKKNDTQNNKKPAKSVKNKKGNKTKKKKSE